MICTLLIYIHQLYMLLYAYNNIYQSSVQFPGLIHSIYKHTHTKQEGKKEYTTGKETNLFTGFLVLSVKEVYPN